MTHSISRRIFLSGLASGLGTTALANAPEVSLRPQMRPGTGGKKSVTGARALIEAAKLDGNVSFSVVDVKTGFVLEEHNGATGLPPASVVKAVTALYALSVLGADYRFKTRLVATGPVSNGVLQGDLILSGGGDPTLDTDGLARLAAMLKTAGVREVKGSLRTYGGALPHVREIDREEAGHVAYNAAISGLNLNYNRVHFEWKRADGDYTTTMDARTKTYRPGVRVARISIADRSGPVYTYADRGTYEQWTVARKALGKGGARWLPVRKPEAYTAEVFATLARSYGIVLEPGTPLGEAPDGTILATHQSAPLRDVLRDMLKYSNNMTAEAVGLTATAARKGGASSLRASALEMSLWARKELRMSGAHLVDHSGLGDASRVTTATMARALAAVHRDGALKPILKPITLRDEENRPDKDHPIKVMAKTGTLYFVSALAGYMTARDGTELAFAIFTVNDELRAGVDRSSGQRPKGAGSWNKRSKNLQQKLIERWGAVYGS